MAGGGSYGGRGGGYQDHGVGSYGQIAGRGGGVGRYGQATGMGGGYPDQGAGSYDRRHYDMDYTGAQGKTRSTNNYNNRDNERQKPPSMYGSLGRTRVEEGGCRDWSSSWRSRSSEPSSRGELFGAKDYSTTGRDFATTRNRFRDRSASYRPSLVSEDYSRIRTTGRDPYPLPPMQRKSPDLHSILVKPTSAQNSSTLNKLDLNSRTRSKSFLDINESNLSQQVKTNRPKRHQTLTFGVSEDDLERARSVMRSSSRADDLSRNQDNKRSSSRHSLPDVFDGSSQDFGRLGMTEVRTGLV